MSVDSLPKKADLVLLDLGMMLQSEGISLSDVFTVIDQDGDSTISPDEFRSGLFKLGIADLDEGEINRVIDAVDLNTDGQIDLKELQNSFNERNMPTRIVGEKAGIQHNISSGEKFPSGQNRRGLIVGISLILIITASILFYALAEPFPLAGEWMQANGEVYTIESDGSGSNPSCKPIWTIEGNETTHTEDCTSLSPDGEPLWTKKIYSFEFVDDVLFMKYLSVENQDGYTAAPSDILCTAWVLEEQAPDAETWETIVSATVMPDMCTGIAGLTD